MRQARKSALTGTNEAARLRLLEAEILIYAQKEGEGLALLAEPLAPALAAGLGARHAMLTGTALRRRSRWTEARSKLEWAIGEARRRGDGATEVMARVQWAAGTAMPGQWSGAVETLQEASRIASSLGDPYLLNVVRFNQASLAMKRGEPERSTELYRAIADEAGGGRGNQVMFARALDNIAINYQRVGDYERALDYNSRALAVFEKLDRLPIDAMQTHGSRGRLLYLLDKPQEAVAELERALALARKRGDPGQIRRWSDNLGEALLAVDRVDDAERLTLESLKSDPAWPYSLLSRGLVHERRGRLGEARRDWERALADPRCSSDVRLEATFGLARLYTAAGDRQTARRWFQKTLSLADEFRASLRTDDFRLTVLGSVIDVYRSYAAALVSWGDEGEALRVEESSRARLLGAGQPASAADLARLGAGTRGVILAYWLSPRGTYVRVFGGGRAERVNLPGAEPRSIARLVREHNELIERQLADPRQGGPAAQELYQLLVAPVEGRLRAAGTRVMVIPDDALHRLNFETLVRVKDGRPGFWIEDVTLQIAPSLSLLAAPQHSRRISGGRRMLLIGDSLEAPEFPRLKHAAAEMKTIGEAFGRQSVTEIAGAAATPSAYAGAAPRRFSHIHFTAHAQADRESPLDSAVILTPEPSPGGEPCYRLRAREVSAIGLDADLVTISACRSAGNRAVAGEGLVGLAWAFQRAGAGNVVAGLWDVNDRSTAQLMSRFYAAIREGLPPGQALRAAKLDFISGGGNNAKPYYWAPFQIYSRSLAE